MAKLNLNSFHPSIAREKKHQIKHHHTHSSNNSGFTLVEVLIVVIIIGVLSAIVGPGWLAFVNRQRVNKANDAVLGAIQEAQRKARSTKRNYSVSFRVNPSNTKEAQVAVYPDVFDPNTPTANNPPSWKSLGGETGVKPGEILVGTNMTDTRNTVAGPVSFAPGSLTTPKTITFDYTGGLLSNPLPNLGTATPPADPPGIRIAVTTPNNPDGSGYKRCVVVRTLIGGIQIPRLDQVRDFCT